MMVDSKELAEWLHDNYEQIANEKNWDTQKDCKVAFKDLPDANKNTMLQLAERIIEKFNLKGLN